MTSVISASTLRAAIQASHSTASKPRTRPSCQIYVRINPSPESNFAPRDVENQHTVSTLEGNDKPRMRRAIPIAVIGLQQMRITRRSDGSNAATNVHDVGEFSIRDFKISGRLSLVQISSDRVRLDPSLLAKAIAARRPAASACCDQPTATFDTQPEPPLRPHDAQVAAGHGGVPQAIFARASISALRRAGGVAAPGTVTNDAA